MSITKSSRQKTENWVEEKKRERGRRSLKNEGVEWLHLSIALQHHSSEIRKQKTCQKLTLISLFTRGSSCQKIRHIRVKYEWFSISMSFKNKIFNLAVLIGVTYVLRTPCNRSAPFCVKITESWPRSKRRTEVVWNATELQKSLVLSSGWFLD